MIRQVRSEDASKIAEIYNYYILNSSATFEEKTVDKAEMRRRIQNHTAELPWIVYEKNNQIIGFAYANKWKSRSAYRYAAESTIYIKQDELGMRIGSLLYKELIKLVINLGYHTIMGGIALPNEASITLHEKLGFKKVAHFKELGYKFNNWIDVAYWELLIRPGENNI